MAGDNLIARAKERVSPAHWRLGTQFAKFALVGTTGTVVDFGLFTLLWRGAGLNPILASAISFCAAVVNNFVLNRLWTFADVRGRDPVVQLGQFTVIATVGLGLNLGLMAVLIELVGPRLSLMVSLGALGAAGWRLLEPALQWWPLFSKAVATVVVLFWNFAGNRLWTFRER
jgi:putative flippase GtrA